jgi:hypothetical protein
MLYIVKWVSQRGFANEGEYLYGLREAVINDADGLRARVRTTISRHRTLEAARRRAQRELRNDQAMKAWGTELHISIRHVN